VLDEFKVDVPEGKSGEVEIKRFVVDAAGSAFTKMRAAMKGRGYVPEGTYTEIRRAGVLWMSDTPDEIRDHLGFIGRASGRVLVTGLGLGMVAAACLRKPEVEKVVVVEIDPDVVALVAPHLVEQFGDRVDVVLADAYKWKPAEGSRVFDCAWHDVWPDICGSNARKMRAIVKHYAPFMTAPGFFARQACWCERETARENRRR